MLRKICFTILRLFPSFIRLKLYSFLSYIGRRNFGSTDLFVQRLPFGLFLKRGHEAIQEAEAMRIAKECTAIPVPTVLDVVGNCLVMTRLPGEPVGTRLAKMGPEEFASFQSSLSEIVQQLRRIAPEVDGTVSGPHPAMPCCDVNRVDETAFGPFPNVAAFHEFLLSRLPPSRADELREEASKVYSKHHRTCFTHGDLNLQNILYEKGRITGIVDWTCAGWFPEYWELTKAVYVHRQFGKWRSLWDDILPEYTSELDLEMKMWNH